MEPKIVSSNVRGISYREHKTRKHGRQKDKYFILRYRLNKKPITEAVGWASEGWTLQKVNEILCELKRNIREGVHPQTLKEKREMSEKAKRAQEVEEIVTLSDRITLQETFDEYFKSHKLETTIGPQTATMNYYKNWIKKSLGEKKLVDISSKDIQNIIEKASKKLAPTSLVQIKAVLRQIFNFAKNRDLYFKDNPAMKIKIKTKDNKRTRFLTKEEAIILLNALKKRSIDVHDMALLSLYTGMRAGEVLNLQWEHVLWNSNRISIVDPNNGESRMEPIHPLVNEMLQRRYNHYKNGYVFKAKNGGKIGRVSPIFCRVVNALGFNDKVTDLRQKVVFHTLRHTHASWLVMNGVDLYTTQKLMGHKTIQMTQRYSHLAPEYLDKAVNSLDSI